MLFCPIFKYNLFKYNLFEFHALFVHQVGEYNYINKLFELFNVNEKYFFEKLNSPYNFTI